MKKSAIMQAIDRLNNLADSYAANKRVVRANDLYNAALICESLLATEKADIEEAWGNGYLTDASPKGFIMGKEQYYNKTFNTLNQTNERENIQGGKRGQCKSKSN